MDKAYSVHLLCWHDGQPLLLALREAIRIRDQRMSARLGSDGLDKASRHALALSAKGSAIGCGRITAPMHPAAPCIGGIAVLPEWRNKKVGTALLELLLDYARSQYYPEVEIEAPTQAVPFYHRRFGFEVAGEEFMAANMPYTKMRLVL